MGHISAFVGHSFLDSDMQVVRTFLDYFNELTETISHFSWENALSAEPKELSDKIKEKMEGKNLFIGICTNKEYAINPKDLSPMPLLTSRFFPKRGNFTVKVSDWILQEIGFAVGREMQIIIFLEEGVRIPGGLQGALEYIPFNRDNPQKSFEKFLQMLRAAKEKSVGGASASPPEKADSIETEDKPSIETEDKPIDDIEDKMTPKDEWVTKDYEFGLWLSIKNENEEKESEINDRYLATLTDEETDNEIKWQVLKQYVRHIFNRESAMAELVELQRKHPDNREASHFLGKAYESFEDFEHAFECFFEASSKSDDVEEKIFSLSKACYSAAKASKDEAVAVTLEGLKALTSGVDGGDIAYLEALKEVASIQKEDEVFCAALEGILDIRPDDSDTRFSLAYKYSSLDESDLALYHYTILGRNAPSGMVYNNLGVAEANLSLSAHSVLSYREAERLDETLAMSNIAYKFINEGFLNEAEEICKKAMGYENYDHRVNEALAKKNKIERDETESENTILEKTRRRRQFYKDYAFATTKETLNSISGKWEGPEGELQIEIKDGQFCAAGTYEKTESTQGMSGFLVGRPAIPPQSVRGTIHYNGPINGTGVVYKMKKEPEGHVSLLAIGTSKEGLMVISDDLSEISVYEKGTREAEKFYTLKRLTE